MLASMSTFNDICLTQAAYTDSGDTEKATAILKQSVY